jgi:hypothetical protein
MATAITFCAVRRSPFAVRRSPFAMSEDGNLNTSNRERDGRELFKKPDVLHP